MLLQVRQDRFQRRCGRRERSGSACYRNKRGFNAACPCKRLVGAKKKPPLSRAGLFAISLSVSVIFISSVLINKFANTSFISRDRVFRLRHGTSDNDVIRTLRLCLCGGHNSFWSAISPSAKRTPGVTVKKFCRRQSEPFCFKRGADNAVKSRTAAFFRVMLNNIGKRAFYKKFLFIVSSSVDVNCVTAISSGLVPSALCQAPRQPQSSFCPSPPHGHCTYPHQAQKALSSPF